jgi:exosortase/archaeosortase family protein
MPDTLDFSSLSLGWLVAILIAAALFGGGGYLLAHRRVRQPIVVFFVRFGVVFLLLIVIEAAILSLAPSVHEALGHATATLVGGPMDLAGAEPSVSGAQVAVQEPFIVFNIDAACLGGLLLWAYVALVLAESRASRRQRATGVAVGIAVLVAFNFLRVLLSVYLQWLTEVNIHDYFYLVNMLVVLVVWAGWLRTLKPGRPPAPSAAPEHGLGPGLPGD